MLIHVGILGNDPGWRTLLRQEGVPHSPVSGATSHGMFSAMVVSGDVESSGLEIVRSFLTSGGSVLCTGSAFARLSGTQTKRLFNRYVLGDPGGEHFNQELTDLFVESDIPAHANSLETSSGVPSAYLGEFGGGHLVVLPFDPSALALDRRVAAKSFYSTHRRLPFERVSLVSKGGLLRIVSRALMVLHHRRGLPYVHQWYYPSNRQSMFAFRIDTDYAERGEIEELRNLAQKWKIPLTWFVDAGSQRNILSLFREMRGDEAGIHCFHHRAFREPEAHAANIRRAVEEFDSAGMPARSYAAPYGLWDEPQARAVEQFKFLYSSEFSYDYDNLPTFPYLSGGFIPTLQVPIHPISIGSLRRQGFREGEMSDYFRSVIDRKIQAREPVFLYHHPKNGHIPVLEKIFAQVKERGIVPTRMIDFAAWWKERNSEGWRISAEGSSLGVEIPPVEDQAGRPSTGDVHKGTMSEDFGKPWLHIIRPGGMEAFHSPGPELNLGDLKWEKPAPWPPLPADIARIRKFNPWIPIIRIEDRLASLFKRPS
jgi:hypothetical protein